MARPSSNSKSSSKQNKKGNSPSSDFIRKRVAWIITAGSFIFIVAALLGFNPADWPSHSVAPVNQQTTNWCGPVGAFLAYYLYYTLGPGIWVGLALLLTFLIATISGKHVSHLPLRAAGAVLMILALSGLIALALPTIGPFPEGSGGLLAKSGTLALVDRFNTFGSVLILLLVLAVGAVTAVDELVLALPVLILRSLGILKKVPVKSATKSTAGVLTRIITAVTPSAPTDTDQTASISASGRKVPVRIHSRNKNNSETIDPNAGGIGAVRSFNEDESKALSPLGTVSSNASDDSDDKNPVAVKSREINMAALRAKIAKLPVNFSSKKSKTDTGVKGAGTPATEDDLPRSENYTGYQFPVFDLLENPEYAFNERMEEFVREQASSLEEALQTYGINGEVVGIDSGPVITLYEVQLAPGTKVSSVQSISSDIARSLRAQNIRIVPNMAGKTTVGIEVPNLQKEKVRIKELMTSTLAAKKMRLPMFLGKDASGTPLIADLTAMPHMLIAGTTGSGKSVCMNTIIMSFLFTKRPDELKLILVDPKMVEMSQFRDIPHLMCPVVTEMSKAAAILEWAVTKMEERYELLAEVGVRDIAAFNKLEWDDIKERIGELSEEEEARFPKKLPYIVFMIDELADLIMTNKEVEDAIVRIAQKARAVGIHLILATQRPQANVVTGLIKSNMPCRTSFKVSSGMDSRIVLDQKGAELLLGQGDMLFLSPRSSELIRAQGTLVEDIEIRKVVRFLKTIASPSFERQLVQIRSTDAQPLSEEDRLSEQERDPLFFEAVRIVVESQRGSVSLLQRRLAIGYTRSSRLIDQIGKAGIIGEHKGSVAREVLLSPEEWEEMRRMMEEEEAQGTLFAGEETDKQDNNDIQQHTPAAIDNKTIKSLNNQAASNLTDSPDDAEENETTENAPWDENEKKTIKDTAEEDENEEQELGEDDEVEYEYVDEDGNPIPTDELEENEEYEYIYEDAEKE